jgi:hypothetical protein
MRFENREDSGFHLSALLLEKKSEQIMLLLFQEVEFL